MIRVHPVDGAELSLALGDPALTAIVRHHHERLDGSGYPDRLRGEEIPLAAQIVGILDVYDALTTPRPHAPALPAAQAIKEITRCRGAWSERVYRAFLSVVGP